MAPSMSPVGRTFVHVFCGGQGKKKEILLHIAQQEILLSEIGRREKIFICLRWEGQELEAARACMMWREEDT